MTKEAAFAGMTVASLESRMAKEMARLIEHCGGKPLVAPALQEVPIQDNPAALRLGDELIGGQIDLLILMTGIGATALLDILQSRHPLPSILEGLKRTATVARGPKPAAALKAHGITPTLTVPEPNTWVEVLATLDSYRPLKGLRVVVQEYGTSNPELVESLKQRGADVFPVPIYRWTLPEDKAPLRQVLGEILAGQVQVMLITNAAQIDHVMQLLEQDGNIARFTEACRKMVVASIGPTASERLRHYHLPVDFEPSHSKMGILVKETSEQAQALLQQKQSA